MTSWNARKFVVVCLASIFICAITFSLLGFFVKWTLDIYVPSWVFDSLLKIAVIISVLGGVVGLYLEVKLLLIKNWLGGILNLIALLIFFVVSFMYFKSLTQHYSWPVCPPGYVCLNQ